MWPNAQETADLVTLTEEILNGKHHFFWSVTFKFEKEQIEFFIKKRSYIG